MDNRLNDLRRKISTLRLKMLEMEVAIRDQVNQWIRTSGEYDAVVDFDAQLADPADPHSLASAFDSGDHLHPNEAGYRTMAATVNLADIR